MPAPWNREQTILQEETMQRGIPTQISGINESFMVMYPGFGDTADQLDNACKT